MTPQRIRQIKREIRVLGVAARRTLVGITIIGVVYRGNLWIDGVLRKCSKAEDITEAIEEMLTNSPHSGQVRVILLNHKTLPPEATVSRDILYEHTGKPVILIGDSERAHFSIKIGGEKLLFSTSGLSHWSAEGVLKASIKKGTTPEAIRVAELILSSLSDDLDT